MYINFFYLLFILATGAFSAIFILRERDNKLIFSVLSVILFAALALASFGIELLNVVVVDTSVVETTTVIYSPSFAYVCMMFSILSLISSINTALSFLSKGESNNDSGI